MEIIVAIIAAIGVVLAALIQKSRKENGDDHRMVMDTLRDVGQRVTHIDIKVERLDNKIEKINDKVNTFTSNGSQADRRDQR